ncbi:CapA family protein [Nocardioides sp. HDW12B]|uniref:CapA family protein n=1 Tax=Nocardioides sp. HDW12B TaxID=2714939 RepID=UPI0014088774|nr:CapA family protein [Nocardioides sp. HDW12B]QIK66160.1 CapA family protein [Nocardioides sp. HDW12B]
MAVLVLSLAACDSGPRPGGLPERVARLDPEDAGDDGRARGSDGPPRGTVRLAFAGDVHFELQHRRLLGRPATALRAIAPALRSADVTMVNLESAVTRRGTPEPKKYHFRTDRRALDVLAGAGVDVASLANNHAVDYGAVGLRDTLAAKRSDPPVALVGVGADRREAFAAHRVRVGSTDLAFLAASSRREYTMDAWSAAPGSPGIAAARHPRPRDLLDAVEREAARADVVVVYLHWGDEYARCPDPKQRTTARALVAAGADVVVGTHAHVLQGSGWRGDSYVNYGLGNFLWYHNYRREDTGVLQVTIRDGEVVGDAWTPAAVDVDGSLPRPVSGPAAAQDRRAWERLRSCTDLAGSPQG